MLEQTAVPNQGGEVRTGGIVSNVDQCGIDLFPLLVDLPIDLRGAEQLLFLQAVGQGRKIEKVRGGTQLLGHQPDVFVGLIIPGWDTGVAHQRADVGDAAVGLRIFFQPGHQLSDQVPPAHTQAMGTELSQQFNGPLGEGLIGGVVVLAVLYQDTAPDGTRQPEPVQQTRRLRPRLMDGDLHHPQLPRVREHPADERTGYPQLSGDIALLLILQIIPAGYVSQAGPFFLTYFHDHTSFAEKCYICYL